jgi:hypothetical protein
MGILFLVYPRATEQRGTFVSPGDVTAGIPNETRPKVFGEKVFYDKS